MGHKGAFGGPGNVTYIDCGGGHTAVCNFTTPLMGFIVCTLYIHHDSELIDQDRTMSSGTRPYLIPLPFTSLVIAAHLRTSVSSSVYCS